jgi:hypothetical protein
LTKPVTVTTVFPMAFVWSRLALAALLAAGAACAQAQDDARCQRSCDEPRLACTDEAPLLVTGCRDDAFDDPVIATASPSVARLPRTAIDLTPPIALDANAATRDVLDVAPKTSPPLS